jgi:eukaryotic-like serine/threonine-protein kinase
LAARGDIAIAENDARSANTYFATALQRAETMPSVFDEDRQRRIKGLLAFSYIRLGDGAKAEPLFREIAEEYSGIGGPASPDALRTRIYLSQALLTQGKYAEAVREENLIYPALVQRLGQDHEATMAVLGTRAASEGHLRMWDAAARDDLALHDQAVRKLGPESVLAIGSLSDAGLSQCSAGQYVQGESNARKAFHQSNQAFGPRAALTGGCSFALATCLIGLNKLQEAWELLQNIDVAAVVQLSGDPNVSAQVALAQGEIASRRGNYAVAEQYAKVAASALDRPDADMSDKQSLRDLRNVIQSHLRSSK